MNLQKTVYHDGVYCWDCEIDDAYKDFEFRRSLRMGFWIFGITALVFYGLMIACREPVSVPILLGAFALSYLSLAIPAVCIRRSSRVRREHFRMTDKMIQIGAGKSAVSVFFRDVRRVEPDPDHHRFILSTRFTQPVICVPAEDFEPLREAILSRAEASP